MTIRTLDDERREFIESLILARTLSIYLKTQSLEIYAGCPMRRRHAPPPAHPFYIYIFKQHPPSTAVQRNAIRQEPSLPKIN
ncbi:MAG: hypothetical protein VCB60_01545 [Alphaproteobacteria bacterium]